AEGVSQDRLRLIYNGIELPSPESGRTKESVRTQLGVSGGALVFILVANLIPYKGHADLLHALGMVRSQLPRPWTLLCVGRDDGLQASLVQLSHELQIADSVVFLGQRSDVADLLAAADICLLCSHEEGFSNSILEGMAAGLPMVVTDVGGNSEAVVDGMTGLVVPPYSPDRLGAAIVSLANNLPLRHKMGMAAQKRVKEEFSLAGCVQRYADLYEGIMG
ncbi:MAG: glycosyltransferase, partial [Desulfobulbaceae bacterium]|nr:glycosyltransferase [Desulfobulbaceae bacterium]